MKRVLLDTNFILTCVKEKIDFFHEIKLLGIGTLIPSEVVEEIEKILNSKQKFHIRQNARLALDLILKNEFNEIKLSKNSNSKNVDGMIVAFAKKHPSVIIATLDRILKKKLKNPKMVVRGKKKIEVIN